MARTFTLRQVGLFGTAVLAIGFAYGVRSSDPEVPTDTGAEVLAEAAPQAVDDASAEGITVHGHWKLEIRDPDGTVANVVEFENALDPIGALELPRILGRVSSVAEWDIVLQDISGGNPPCLDGGQPQFCVITELVGPDDQFRFHNLTVTVPSRGDAQEGVLILSGTATAARDGQIADVRTNLQTPCNEGTFPECGSSGFITSTNLATPVVVQAGQSILATVQISFS